VARLARPRLPRTPNPPRRGNRVIATPLVRIDPRASTALGLGTDEPRLGLPAPGGSPAALTAAHREPPQQAQGVAHLIRESERKSGALTARISSARWSGPARARTRPPSSCGRPIRNRARSPAPWRHLHGDVRRRPQEHPAHDFARRARWQQCGVPEAPTSILARTRDTKHHRRVRASAQWE
jgi:hypothetical protein